MILDPATDADSTALVAEAEALRPNSVEPIASAHDYEQAATRIRDIRTMEHRLDEHRKALTRPLDAAKRTLMSFFVDPIARLTTVRHEYEARMREWDDEQARIRREAERQAAEAARRERERQEREAAAIRARAEEAARKARAKAEAAAAALAAKGRAELAEARRRQAEEAETAARLAAEEAEANRRLEAQMMPAAPVVEAVAPKVKGVHTRRSWQFRIVDAAAIPREYLAVDETKIGKVVRALGAETAIAGIEVFEASSYVARTR